MNPKLKAVIFVLLLFIPTYLAVWSYVQSQDASIEDSRAVVKMSILDPDGGTYVFSPENEGEDAEKSALQITGILFSTPQISVDLDKISEDQRKMLRFWLGFMSEKRELLQKSSFEPSRGYANFPSVTVRNASERLTALYAENLLMLDEMAEQVYIVNAYDRKPVYLGCEQPSEAEYTILNCMGEEIARGTLTLGSTPTAAEIPFNGMMILKTEKEHEHDEKTSDTVPVNPRHACIGMRAGKHFREGYRRRTILRHLCSR